MSQTLAAPGLPEPEGLVLPPWLEGPRRLLAAIGRVELVLAVIALVIVVLLSGAQAILRYTLDAQLWWAQEVAQLTIIVAYFFGVSYVFKVRQYILIEFLSSKFSLRVQMVMYVAAQLLTIGFAATVVVLIWRFAPALMGMTTPLLGLPDLIRAAPLAVASSMQVLTSLYYLAFGLWVLARGIEGREVAEVERWALVATVAEDPQG